VQVTPKGSSHLKVPPVLKPKITSLQPKLNLPDTYFKGSRLTKKDAKLLTPLKKSFQPINYNFNYRHKSVVSNRAQNVIRKNQILTNSSINDNADLENYAQSVIVPSANIFNRFEYQNRGSVQQVHDQFNVKFHAFPNDIVKQLKS
jgi:hypothetical protein